MCQKGGGFANELTLSGVVKFSCKTKATLRVNKKIIYGKDLIVLYFNQKFGDRVSIRSMVTGSLRRLPLGQCKFLHLGAPRARGLYSGAVLVLMAICRIEKLCTETAEISNCGVVLVK